MAKKRKRKASRIDPNDVLEGNITPSAQELARLIHRINPTGQDLPSRKEAERYKMKSRLQSLLIRRFGKELAVILPDAENPGLVALDLPRCNEEACHALMDELDEDARAWVQKQIDLGLSGTTTVGNMESTDPRGVPSRSGGPRSAADVSPIPERTQAEDPGGSLSPDELVRLGRKALAEYDYEACEQYYRRALESSPDHLDAILSLLEFYVDHLAAYEKALALSDSIPSRAKKNDAVRIPLALAAARCGQVDRALDYIKRIIHPNASEVYLICLHHLIQNGDTERSSELLGILNSLEQAELRPELEELGRKIRSLKAKELKPLEQEMMCAWQQGRTKASLDLADRILSESPENGAARSIRRQFERQQLEARIDQLLLLADKARADEDFGREAELLSDVMAMGRKAEDLMERLAHAQEEAKRRKEALQIQTVKHTWAEGNLKEALMRYSALNEQQQSCIQRETGDPRFVWFDDVLSTQNATKPAKLVDAVLVLGRCREALSRGEAPDTIIAEMAPHRETLQSVPDARDAVQQAERMSRRIKREVADRLLADVRGFLETENLDGARDAIDRIKVHHLSQVDKKIFEDVSRRLQDREKTKRLENRYTDACDRGDHLSARTIARDLAEHSGKDVAEKWLARASEQTVLVHEEWSLSAVDALDLPVFYAACGLRAIAEDNCCCLLADGRRLVLATTHQRWVFLRIFRLDDQKFEKAILLRTPGPLCGCCVYAKGSELWITGQSGLVLNLGLDPLDILSWHDFSDAARQGETIQDAWLFPKSRSLWIYKDRLGQDPGEEIEVINIDKNRSARRLKVHGHPIAVNAGGHFRVAVQNMMSKTVQVFSEKGRPLESFSLGYNRVIHTASIHPDSGKFVLLSFDDSIAAGPFLGPDTPQEGDLAIHLEIRPGPDREYQPVRIENTNGELRHDARTSLDSGIVAVLFDDDSAEDAYSLAVFKDTRQGLESQYQLRTPGRSILACDEFSRRVVLVSFQHNRFQSMVLDDTPPVFAPDNGSSARRKIPAFDGLPYFCGGATGASNAMSLAYMMQINDSSARELHDTLREIKTSDSKTPDEIAAFIDALYRTLHLNEVEDMRRWMREQHPGHVSVVLGLAGAAAGERNWPAVVSLLEGVAHGDLDDGTGRHVCHLLGMGYFADGDMERALRTWTAGMSYGEGRCDLDPYIEYAELALMPESERKNGNSEIQQELSIFEAVDDHLSHERYDSAIEALGMTEVLFEGDMQLLARLTWAYLQRDVLRNQIEWVCKVVVLAEYCESHGLGWWRANRVLPPHVETWPDSRLDGIAAQAAQWLESQ